MPEINLEPLHLRPYKQFLIKLTNKEVLFKQLFGGIKFKVSVDLVKKLLEFQVNELTYVLANTYPL